MLELELLGLGLTVTPVGALGTEPIHRGGAETQMGSGNRPKATELGSGRAHIRI